MRLNVVYDKNSGKGVKGANIVCDGDSITFGYLQARIDSYPGKLGARRPLAQVTNLGVNGSKVADLVSRAATVDALYDASMRFNILCVMIGVNDLYNSGGVGATPASVWTDLKAYLAPRRAKGWKIVLGTTTIVVDAVQPLPSRFLTYETDRQTLISLMKAEPNVYDVLAPTGDDVVFGKNTTQVTSPYLIDGAHPSPLGAARLADIFQSSIEDCYIKFI